MFSRFNGLDEIVFTFGNLAPDSGVPNEDWSAFDPPKEVTHFLSRGQGESEIRDLEFYRSYVQPLSSSQDGWRYSFNLGYFAHLFCDVLWTRLLIPATKKQASAALANDAHAAWKAIKDDWYSLDRKYVQSTPSSSFWRVLMANAKPKVPLPFLSDAGFHHSLDYIRSLNTDANPSWVLDRSYPHLNEANMSRIVNDCAHLFLKAFERKSQFCDHMSAAKVLDVNDLVPYEAPVGNS